MYRLARSIFVSAAVLSIASHALGADFPELAADAQAPAPAAAASQPTSSDLDALAAISLFGRGERDEAHKLFKEILARNPNDTVALYWSGLIEMEIGLELRRKAQVTDSRALDAQARNAFRDAREHLARLLSAAAASEEVRRTRPVEAGLTLGIAQLAEDNKSEQVSMAESAVRTLTEYNREMDNSPAGPDYLGHFFLGIAHWRLGTYGNRVSERAEASKAFDTAVQYAPESDPAALPGTPPPRETVQLYRDYYDGIVHVQDRDLGRAIDLLDKVARGAEKYDLLRQLRDDAQRLKKGAEEAQHGYEPMKVGFLEFRGDIDLGNGYDSNVLLLGDGTSLPRRIAHQDDYFMQVQAGAELAKRFQDSNAGSLRQSTSVLVGMGGDTTQRWQPSIGEYDIQQYRGRVFAQWELPDDWFSYWEYQYSNTQLGREPYIDAHSGYFSLTKRFSKPEVASYGTYTSAYYQYENRTYHDPLRDPRLDRDGNYHLIGLRQSFDLVRADKIWARHYDGKTGRAAENDRERYMRIAFGYEFRDERTSGNEFDMHGHTILGGIEIPLPFRLMLDYGVRCSWDDYNSYSLYDFQRRPRDDFRQVHGIGLTYMIVGRGEARPETLEMKLRASADYTIQDSNIMDSANQAVYSYDRGQYFLGLHISF